MTYKQENAQIFNSLFYKGSKPCGLFKASLKYFAMLAQPVLNYHYVKLDQPHQNKGDNI